MSAGPFEAVESGNPVAVRAYLRAGADPNARDLRMWCDGRTPLHWRSMRSRRVLLDAGADIEPANDEGYTAQARAGHRVYELLMQRLAASAH